MAGCQGTPPTRGGEREAVVGVTLRGLTIRDAAATYLEPHGMPSVRPAVPPPPPPRIEIASLGDTHGRPGGGLAGRSGLADPSFLASAVQGGDWGLQRRGAVYLENTVCPRPPGLLARERARR
jgi:hypothetical protein